MKYEHRPDIRDRASLEQNFRKRLEELNRVHLTDAEFSRRLDEIVTPDVFTAARILRERNSHHRFDVILLINGVPVVQIELKTLGISPRRAMKQIVEYKNDPGNGYTKTILCFLQLFIVRNRNRTFYFANNWPAPVRWPGSDLMHGWLVGDV